MQYKIPVQIENEDPIMFGLSLRQLLIIIGGLGIGYGFFKNLQPTFGDEAALIPLIIFTGLGIIIAVFKYSEMTFIPFILAFLRFKLNQPERRWQAGTDSFSLMDIGYINDVIKTDEDVDLNKKLEKLKDYEKNLEKI